MRQLLTCLVFVLIYTTGATTYANSTTLTTHTSAGKALHPKIDQRIQSLFLPLEAKSTDHYLHFKLKDYLNGGRSTERMLGRARKVFPVFETALCEQGLPDELKYLAVAESMLRTHARSQVGALGLWQLMPATARQYGLRVNYRIDERLDLTRSSEAAARMLKDLYDQFGDWHLVVAAYNAGPARISRAVRYSGGVADFDRVRSHLPRETRNYVAGYIAAAYILNYYASHGLEARPTACAPVQIADVKLHRRISLTKIAKATGVPKQELRRLNPAIRTNVIPTTEGGYTIHLPAGTKDALLVLLWGRDNLVQTTALQEARVATAAALAEGFNPSAWLLGCKNVVGSYTDSALYVSHAGTWSSAWLDAHPVFALA